MDNKKFLDLQREEFEKYLKGSGVKWNKDGMMYALERATTNAHMIIYAEQEKLIGG